MTDRQANSPNIRDVFSENLKILVNRKQSISQVTRDLGLNRTQFSRYLSGTAYPRPDVLDKICKYFDVDGRIMLEPLANLAKSPEEIFVDTLDISPFMNKMKGFDHARAPDGLYQWIQPTHLSRGNVNISLWHLFTLPNGYKALKASVPTYIAKASGLSCLWKDRKQPGIIFQNSGGFTTLLSSHYNSLLFMSYFTYGYRGIANIYTGFTAVSQSAGPTQSQAQPSMLKRIQPNFAAAIKARRECGVKKMEELPEFEREYFETWSPFAPGYKL